MSSWKQQLQSSLRFQVHDCPVHWVVALDVPVVLKFSPSLAGKTGAGSRLACGLYARCLCICNAASSRGQPPLQSQLSCDTCVSQLRSGRWACVHVCWTELHTASPGSPGRPWLLGTAPAQPAYGACLRSLADMLSRHGKRLMQPHWQALGLKLKAYGHRVRLASHKPYRQVITEVGLEYYPLGECPPASLSVMQALHAACSCCQGTRACRRSEQQRQACLPCGDARASQFALIVKLTL